MDKYQLVNTPAKRVYLPPIAATPPARLGLPAPPNLPTPESIPRPQTEEKPYTFRTELGKYEVVKVIVEPDKTGTRMSDGVRLLRTDNGMFRIEKRLRVTTKAQRDRYDAEKDALLQVRRVGGHHHINYFYEEVIPKSKTHRSFILENCNLGSLDDRIHDLRSNRQPFEEPFIWHVFAQMTAALVMLHFGFRDPLYQEYTKVENWNCITHLDIKPANVFFSNLKPPGVDDNSYPRVVLGDFGCCVTKKHIHTGMHSKNWQPFGTEGWFPPESVSPTGELQRSPYGKQTDVWQLGGLMQAMCLLTYEPSMTLIDQKRPSNGFSAALDPYIASCMKRAWDKRPASKDMAMPIREEMERLGFVKGKLL